MFGETEAYNLNSHVYDGDAPGVYVTIRYSTTKKAAADGEEKPKKTRRSTRSKVTASSKSKVGDMFDMLTFKDV